MGFYKPPAENQFEELLRMNSFLLLYSLVDGQKLYTQVFYKLKAHSSKQKTQPGTRQPITPYNRRLWTLLALGNVCLYIIFRGKTVKNSEAHKTNFSTHSRVFYKKLLVSSKVPKMWTNIFIKFQNYPFTISVLIVDLHITYKVLWFD